MKCAKCGAEIREGSIYCANCGAEAQIVSEINILEEDLLRSMMDEEKEQEQAAQEKRRLQKEQEKKERAALKKKKEQMKKLIVLIVILAAVCAVVGGFFGYRQMNSFDHLMEKAQEDYELREYQSALEYVERARGIDGEDETAALLQAEICARLKDDAKAEELFLQILEKDPSAAEAYTDLLKLYDGQDDYEKMSDLYEFAQAKDAGENIMDLFAGYLVLPPEFDTESGVFDDFIEVAVTVRQRGLQIFYTLDGSMPTRKSERYSEPVKISEPGRTVFTAVCMDREGTYSEPVSAEYEINLKAPAVPKVSPDGGLFTAEDRIVITVPEGVTVYYTWDGKKPTERSEKYRQPLDIPEGNNILSVIAVDSYGNQSEVLKCNYIYYPE